MGLTKAQRHNRMMDRVFEGVAKIDKEAKCPKCGASILRERGLGTLKEKCPICGYYKKS